MATKPIQLDHDGLWELVNGWNGARIVTLITVTVPAMRCRDNPFHGLIEKVVKRNGFCGASYRSVVNRRRQREGQPVDRLGDVLPFTSDPLPWGRHAGRYFIQHTPQHATAERDYLKFLPQQNLCEQYRFCKSKKPVPELALPYLATFLQTKRPGSQRQGLKKPVPWKTIAMESIDQLYIDGEIYLIRHEPTLVAA